MIIGANIKNLRIKYNFTQKQLAEGIGVTPQTISILENNVNFPEISLLPLIFVFWK